MMDTTTGEARPGVIVFPPLIPLSGFLLGLALEAVWPTSPRLPHPVRVGLRDLGAMLLGFGAVGFFWMVATMKRAHTPIHNAQTPLVLVTSGPFRLTRNPMYLFGAIVYAGIALLSGMLWPIALLPVVLTITHYGVVRREEVTLARLFGQSYDDYRARVRRWL